MMRILFLFSIFIVHSTSLSATNYYVSAGRGNADNHGRSPSRPKETIQQAADLTKPGDTVFVMRGVYTNDCPNCNVVEVPNSGSPGKYITYKNYANHRPVISFDGWAGFFVGRGRSYIKISGFEVVGNNAKVVLAKALRQPKSCKNRKGEYDPKYNGNGIGVNGKAHHIIISNNIVRDCGGGGIGVSHADYVTVEDNLVYDNCKYNLFGSSGIGFYQFFNFDNAPGYHNFIRRNRCFNNRSLVPWTETCRIADGNGIIIDDFQSLQNGSKLGRYRGKTLVENNIAWFNGGTGIHAFQSDNVDIINNTAYLNSSSPGLNSGQILSGAGSNNRIINNILVSNGSIVINSNYRNSRLTYENNLHYNVSYPGKEKVAITSLSSITGMNPLFVKPTPSLNANFQLEKNSPAIGRGHPKYFSSTDFNKRVRGQQPTIGAYQM